MFGTDVARVSVTLTCLGLIMPPSAEAAERWFLMWRHGSCADVGTLRRKVPDLGGIKDPDAFAGFMRQNEYEVTSSPLAVPKGRARKVNVPQNVCAQNRLRSPTAEKVFSHRPGFEVASAGVAPGVEPAHRKELLKRFRPQLKDKRIICLNIPDEFQYMDPALIRLLEAKVDPFFRAG